MFLVHLTITPEQIGSYVEVCEWWASVFFGRAALPEASPEVGCPVAWNVGCRAVAGLALDCPACFSGSPVHCR